MPYGRVYFSRNASRQRYWIWDCEWAGCKVRIENRFKDELVRDASFHLGLHPWLVKPPVMGISEEYGTPSDYYCRHQIWEDVKRLKWTKNTDGTEWAWFPLLREREMRNDWSETEVDGYRYWVRPSWKRGMVKREPIQRMAAEPIIA